jgi:hypothetical protein
MGLIYQTHLSGFDRCENGGPKSDENDYELPVFQ